MTDDDRTFDAELAQRLIDHARLDRGRAVAERLARAPAVAWPVDHDHAMPAAEQLAERPAHGFEVRARAMDQHHRQRRRILYSDLHDTKASAGHIDHAACR